jgi:hypothetical protein
MPSRDDRRRESLDRLKGEIKRSFPSWSHDKVTEAANKARQNNERKEAK